MNRPWPSFFTEASRGAGPGVNGPASRSSSTPTPFSGTTSLSPLLPPPPIEPHSLGPGFGRNESIGRGSSEVIPVARAPPPSPREWGQERQQPANRPKSEGSPSGVWKNGAGSGGNHQKRWLTQGAPRGSEDPAAGRTRLIPLVASGREPGGPRQWCEPGCESRVPSSNPHASLRVQHSQPRDQKRGEQSVHLSGSARRARPVPLGETGFCSWTPRLGQLFASGSRQRRPSYSFCASV